MKISLRDLRARPGQKVTLPYNELFDDPQMVKPVLGDIFLAATTALVRLQGNIQTIVKLQCHTCLNYFFKSLSLELNEEFVYEDYLNANALKVKDRELQKEDFFETVPYDGEIDVSDIVFQAITIAIPVYCSCGDKCPGFPVYNTGTGETIKKPSAAAGDMPNEPEWVDPRWHNLKTILPKDNKPKK